MLVMMECSGLLAAGSKFGDPLEGIGDKRLSVLSVVCSASWLSLLCVLNADWVFQFVY